MEFCYGDTSSSGGDDEDGAGNGVKKEKKKKRRRKGQTVRFDWIPPNISLSLVRGSSCSFFIKPLSHEPISPLMCEFILHRTVLQEVAACLRARVIPLIFCRPSVTSSNFPQILCLSRGLRALATESSSWRSSSPCTTSNPRSATSLRRLRSRRESYIRHSFLLFSFISVGSVACYVLFCSTLCTWTRSS